jgi:hypothetical protein
MGTHAVTCLKVDAFDYLPAVAFPYSRISYQEMNNIREILVLDVLSTMYDVCTHLVPLCFFRPKLTISFSKITQSLDFIWINYAEKIKIKTT